MRMIIKSSGFLGNTIFYIPIHYQKFDWCLYRLLDLSSQKTLKIRDGLDDQKRKAILAPVC